MPKQMTLDEFLARIRKKCEGKPYIFRGTPLAHSEEIYPAGTVDGTTIDVKDGISSSLYRDLKEDVVFWNEYRPVNAEDEILSRAKRFYPVGTSLSEILTDLQHLHYSHGKTNLIDFSRSLNIALFFACDGEHKEEPGELILLDPASLRDQECWQDRINPTPCLMEPAKTKYSRERVLFQRSVFVYPPYGYINKDMCDLVTEPVHAYLKQSILDNLHKMHEINPDTIYNDLFGFLANKRNYQTSAKAFSQGVKLANNGKTEEAIKKYDEAIELEPNRHSMPYNNRGNAKSMLGRFQEALPDLDKAIELDKENELAYHNRGITKHHLAAREGNISVKISILESAIDDYDRAIVLSPGREDMRNNRELARRDLKQALEVQEKPLDNR